MNDGYFFNRFASEYQVWLEGQHIGWATTEKKAKAMYDEAKRVKEDHARKNPDESAWEWSTLTAPDKQEVVEVLDFISFRICAWCNEVMGTVEDTGGNNSHGICSKCLEVELAKI